MRAALVAEGNSLAQEEEARVNSRLKETLQADVYRQIASACLAHTGCTAIQTWGFTDKYSWIGSYSKHTRGVALLFDREYRPKPAYEAVRSALEQAKRR